MSPFKFALIIGLAAVAIRSATLIPNDKLFEAPYSDGKSYDSIAHNLIMGNGYINSHNKYRARRAPGYTFMLAGIYSVFGYSVVAVRIVQVLISAWTVVLVYLLARRYFPEEIAVMSAIFLLLSPTLAYFSREIYTECFFTALVLTSFYYFVRVREEDCPNWPTMAIVAGSALGASVLTRPIALLYAFSMGCVWLILVIKRPRIHFPRAILWGSIFILTLVMTQSQIPTNDRRAEKYTIVQSIIYSKGNGLF